MLQTPFSSVAKKMQEGRNSTVIHKPLPLQYHNSESSTGCGTSNMRDYGYERPQVRSFSTESLTPKTLGPG